MIAGINFDRAAAGRSGRSVFWLQHGGGGVSKWNVTECGTSGSPVWCSVGLQAAETCRKQIRSAESKYRTGPMLLQLSCSKHEHKRGLSGQLELCEHGAVWHTQIRFIVTMIFMLSGIFQCTLCMLSTWCKRQFGCKMGIWEATMSKF